MIAFDDMNEALDSEAGGKPRHGRSAGAGAGQFWIRAPALSSLELAIRAKAIEVLPMDVSFVEDDDDDATPEQPFESPRVAENRAAIARIFGLHTSLARSLGKETPGDDLWDRYEKLCAENGLSPLTLKDYPRR